MPGDMQVIDTDNAWIPLDFRQSAADHKHDTGAVSIDE